VLTAAVLAIVVGLTVAPPGIAAPARRAFLQGASSVVAPFVDALAAGEVESILNTLLFVPVGAVLVLLLPRGLWWLAPPAGLMLSVTVEVLQVRIPGRVPDLEDVLWNSAGALAGAVAVALVGALVAVARRIRTRRGTSRAR